jgi:hypothetical protein
MSASLRAQTIEDGLCMEDEHRLKKKCRNGEKGLFHGFCFDLKMQCFIEAFSALVHACSDVVNVWPWGRKQHGMIDSPVESGL